MELKELTDKMIDLLGIKNINEMSERLFEVVTQNDNEIDEWKLSKISRII